MAMEDFGPLLSEKRRRWSDETWRQGMDDSFFFGDPFMESLREVDRLVERVKRASPMTRWFWLYRLGKAAFIHRGIKDGVRL